MKKTPETMLAICESIASGVVPFTRAAAQHDVKPRTFFLWLADENLTVDGVPFGDAVKAARRQALGVTHQSSSTREVHHYHHHDVHVFVDHAAPIVAEIAPEHDAELDEMLNGRTPSAPVVAEIAPEPERIPDKIAEPAPLAIDAAPARPPRSPLEADLFARLAAARAKNVPRADDGSGQTEGPPAPS
jgi:hypothetical protein